MLTQLLSSNHFNSLFGLCLRRKALIFIFKYFHGYEKKTIRPFLFKSIDEENKSTNLMCGPGVNQLKIAGVVCYLVMSIWHDALFSVLVF